MPTNLLGGDCVLAGPVLTAGVELVTGVTGVVLMAGKKEGVVFATE